ncbi:MAG: glycosyl hydrolase [Cyanobacteria bacterium HKST-UBA02]|nr:glycosyl hydrolase [Cyanobacteria bacterium HKST-UBA02]
MASIALLVGTRKGAFILESASDRSSWSLSEPIFLGHIVYHLVADPRKPESILMAAKTGHLGPTVYHSSDAGKTFVEAKSPPAFPKKEGGLSVDSVFWLSPGNEADPGLWYAGTSPPALFESRDHGDTWEPIKGFIEHPMYEQWTGHGPTPGGQLLHSINVDPRDGNHIYVGISVGGVFESIDRGASWTPLNRGCEAEFLPDPEVEFGHDPHCVALHPRLPDRLYQQNHCGIYRLERPASRWQRIGRNMPSGVGDIGFPIVLHPRDPDTVWVFPMDGSTVWPRTSPDGKPAVYMSRDAGESWVRQDSGLPARDAYFTVKRQAMTCDSEDSLGLYFGTSQGEVWGSRDEGETWSCLVSYLPEIYSLSVMTSR